MKMGVLGSGMVAQGLSARLAELGHNVVIGMRDADKLRGWQSSNQRVLIGLWSWRIGIITFLSAQTTRLQKTRSRSC